MFLFLDSGILQPIEYDEALGDSQSYVVKPHTFYLIYWEIHSRALSSLVMSNYFDTTIQERPHVGFRATVPDRSVLQSSQAMCQKCEWRCHLENGVSGPSFSYSQLFESSQPRPYGAEKNHPCCTLSKFLTHKTHITYCFMSILFHLSCCIKVPQTGCLRNLFLPALDPEKSEIKEPVDSVGRGPPPGS